MSEISQGKRKKFLKPRKKSELYFGSGKINILKKTLGKIES